MCESSWTLPGKASGPERSSFMCLGTPKRTTFQRWLLRRGRRDARISSFAEVCTVSGNADQDLARGYLERARFWQADRRCAANGPRKRAAATITFRIGATNVVRKIFRPTFSVLSNPRCMRLGIRFARLTCFRFLFSLAAKCALNDNKENWNEQKG